MNLQNRFAGALSNAIHWMQESDWCRAILTLALIVAAFFVWFRYS
jgi:hypothetical protein